MTIGHGQIQPVDVAELTIKVGGISYEELFYGFAEGDQIVFTFEEVNGKELKEIEILEYPNHSKFMDYKSTKIEKKIIKVTQKAVFQFKFTNSALSGRICKVKIQRIPISESLIKFNTNWKWKTLYDTTYVAYTEDSLTGYEKVQVPYTKKELVKADTISVDKETLQRAHTNFNPDGDRSYVSFTHPANVRTEFLTKEVISWAYYIGTDGKTPQIASVLNLAQKAVSILNPVAGLAMGAVSLVTSTAGTNINYYLMRDISNVNLFMADGQPSYIEKGDASIAAHRFIDQMLQGTIYIGLDNDHTYPVDVLVKFSSIQVTKTYENKQYIREDQKATYAKLNKKRMVVTSTKIMINED
jgi:hypothetical protein